MPTAAETLTPPAAAAPTPDPGTVPGITPPSTVPAGWWDTVKDPEVKSWVASKNLPDAEHALQSYWSLERLMGAEKAGRTVMTPKDETDADGWKAIGSKLGVPANAEEYKLPVPEGQNDGFAKLASGWMQKANIPPVMARQLTEQWNAYATETEKAAKAKSESEVAALTAEWGPKATENTETARRGFREFATQLGITADPKVVEDAFGSANFLKFFLGLGALQAESKFAATDNQGTFSASQKIEMQAQIDKIQADRSAGKINDFQWRNEVEQKYLKLIETVSRIP